MHFFWKCKNEARCVSTWKWFWFLSQIHIHFLLDKNFYDVLYSQKLINKKAIVKILGCWICLMMQSLIYIHAYIFWNLAYQNRHFFPEHVEDYSLHLKNCTSIPTLCTIVYISSLIKDHLTWCWSFWPSKGFS